MINLIFFLLSLISYARKGWKGTKYPNLSPRFPSQSCVWLRACSNLGFPRTDLNPAFREVMGAGGRRSRGGNLPFGGKERMESRGGGKGSPRCPLLSGKAGTQKHCSGQTPARLDGAKGDPGQESICCRAAGSASPPATYPGSRPPQGPSLRGEKDLFPSHRQASAACPLSGRCLSQGRLRSSGGAHPQGSKTKDEREHELRAPHHILPAKTSQRGCRAWGIRTGAQESWPFRRPSSGRRQLGGGKKWDVF